MIVETIMGFLFDLAKTFFAWLGDHLPEPPNFWADVASAISHVTGATSPTVQYFLPIGPALALGVTVTALIVALGLVKLFRRALSLFTGGGGATG